MVGLTLIKSTLSNLPTYFLSLFPIPANVALRLEKLQRDFLWGGLGAEQKFHLVKWDKVCSPISNGDLGIRDMRTFNRALLGKWLWRYHKEPEALWKTVIEIKYGDLWGGGGGGWCTKEVRGAHGVDLWIHIRKGWEVFTRYTRIRFGGGTHIKFWYDIWCDHVALKESFPSLFRVARDIDASVADVLERSGDQIQWNINFSRVAQDWEMSSIEAFYSLLYTTKPDNSRDSLWWIPTVKGTFSMRSFYMSLSQETPIQFPWRKIWRHKAPPKVAIFV
ncbi:hypothetical protein I3843_15G105600 [Carya illinoinensis]|nr:hypothetical protein I3843_15G105600 [Carya illinoinensis]